MISRILKQSAGAIRRVRLTHHGIGGQESFHRRRQPKAAARFSNRRFEIWSGFMVWELSGAGHRQQVCVLNIDGFDQQYSLGFTSRLLFGPARPMSRLIRAVTEPVAPFHPVDQWPPVKFAKGSGRRLALRSTGRAPGVPQASGTSN